MELRFRCKNASGVPLAGCETGVGHEEEPLPDVRSTNARCAEIHRPEGVTLCFHITLNNVEPSEAVIACNLLTKDRYPFGFTMDDVMEPRGP